MSARQMNAICLDLVASKSRQGDRHIGLLYRHFIFFLFKLTLFLACGRTRQRPPTVTHTCLVVAVQAVGKKKKPHAQIKNK
jgi:hypothetical protein